MSPMRDVRTDKQGKIVLLSQWMLDGWVSQFVTNEYQNQLVGPCVFWENTSECKLIRQISWECCAKFALQLCWRHNWYKDTLSERKCERRLYRDGWVGSGWVVLRFSCLTPSILWLFYFSENVSHKRKRVYFYFIFERTKVHSEYLWFLWTATSIILTIDRKLWYLWTTSVWKYTLCTCVSFG